MISSAELAPGNYPQLSARCIDAPNRMWAFPILGIVAKAIILVPVLVWLYILSLIALVMIVINSLQVAFTGKYWDAAYNLILGLLRLETKLTFYMAGLTDRYPGFGLDIASDELFALDVPMPESPSRGFAFPILGGIARAILLIPFMIWSQVVAYGTYLAVTVGSFAVLSAGRYPVSVFELVRDGTRLYLSSACYGVGLSDSYPSFSISTNNAGIKAIFIGLGLLLMVANYAVSSMGSKGS
jgi:hypothetical protein